MATFEYLRISLGLPEQKSLLGSDGEPYKDIERSDYIERVLSRERWDFEYYGSNYSFLFEKRFGDVIVGRIGKETIEAVHSGPDTHYAIKIEEYWKLAWVLFDISKNSQLMAVQTNVASPKNLIRALFDRIESDTPDREYEIFIEYVSQKGQFWDAVEEFKGKITRLEFTFVPPNALGLHEKIREIVDIAADESGAEQTKITHTNKDGGLHPKGEYIKAALETAGEGAGSVSMKAGRKTIFSSSKNRKIESISDDDLPTEMEQNLVMRLINRIFGSET